MKRYRTNCDEEYEYHKEYKDKDTNNISFDNNLNDISANFINDCECKFKSDLSNIITRNAVVSVGSMLCTMDSNRLNTLDHVFMNSIKKKNVKATNQGASGRCWMFSGLNMFRHAVIHALDLENFEFSETYLFFWDKLERANRYIRWFIDHPEVTPKDDAFKFEIDDFTSDGGWWNMFANLVTKYGLIPKSAMKETFQSDDSDDMNQILNTRLQSTVNYIFNNRSSLDDNDLENIRVDCVRQVYNSLVKFLGEPPKKFRWCYTTEENYSNIITDLDPKTFMNMLLPSISMKDFVVLAHLPGQLIERKMYEVKYTNNIYEGDNFTFLNLPINELSKYAKKSILAGIPVWFAGDVSKDFNPFHSALDEKLSNENPVFGENYMFKKSDRITFRNLAANHAMTFVGINIGDNGKPESWQVENSWGYWDNEIPGIDGFLYMSNGWFEQNVMQIVVHKNVLSRTLTKLLDQDRILLNPWDCVAPALKIKPVDAPKTYTNIQQNIYTKLYKKNRLT